MALLGGFLNSHILSLPSFHYHTTILQTTLTTISGVIITHIATYLSTCLLTIGSSTASYDPTSRKNLAVYWGQNSAGAPRAHSLGNNGRNFYLHTVLTPDFDIIILAFIVDMDKVELNFANQQGVTCDPHSQPVKCDTIAKDIDECKKSGNTVLLSIGGSGAAFKGYGTQTAASEGAEKIWKMFGPAQSGDDTNRPFGDTFVDGFNLDLESPVNNVVSFANRMKALMNGNFALSAAPECQSPKNAELLKPGILDIWFVQFYNNPPCYATGNLGPSLKDWTTWAKGNKTKLFVGLPSSAPAAPAGGYIAPEKLKENFNTANDLDVLAGAMLWDASQAWANDNYHKKVKEVLI